MGRSTPFESSLSLIEDGSISEMTARSALLPALRCKPTTAGGWLCGHLPSRSCVKYAGGITCVMLKAKE